MQREERESRERLAQFEVERTRAAKEITMLLMNVTGHYWYWSVLKGKARVAFAAHSLLMEGVIELHSNASSRSVLIKGLKGQYDCVPLYTVYLKSNVVNGW